MEQTLSRQLLSFLDTSPSCYHAVDNLAKELLENGYQRLWEFQPWELKTGGKYFVVRGDSTLAAFRIPTGEFRGFMLAAGHSDSPTFKLREARWRCPPPPKSPGSIQRRTGGHPAGERR